MPRTIPVRQLMFVFRNTSLFAILNTCGKGGGFAPSSGLLDLRTFSIKEPLPLSKVSNTNLEIAGNCKNGSAMATTANYVHVEDTLNGSVDEVRFSQIHWSSIFTSPGAAYVAD